MKNIYLMVKRKLDLGVQVGKIYDEDGIECLIVVKENPRKIGGYEIYGEPTENGKNTDEYINKYWDLRDHWFHDYSSNWFEPNILPFKIQENINKLIEGDIRREDIINKELKTDNEGMTKYR